MNKLILQSIIIVLVLPFHWTCNKSEIYFELQGKVLDETGQALTGIQLELSQQKIESGALNGSDQFIASTTSDGSGSYSFRFLRENALSYKLVASSDVHFDREIAIAFDKFTPDHPHCKDVVLYSSATLNVHIANSNPIDENDYISYRNLNAVFNCPCCDNSSHELEGMDIDTLLTCNLYGNYWLRYEYQVEKTGAFIFAMDSLYIQPGQTNVLEINY
ncbi:MAG: carboxypeptidase regulatory-like domain-containing protein [Flavobacteriales bacterium]|nr:carboxypeptidase regulatory-like domain-containing protein [Flavobacteriales bacterium]